ncbi:MAG: tyrosine-type recombinase/integrase [Microthrixaceae bacterium]
MHPHKLRHTHVSLALDAGAALEAIIEQVGHSSSSTIKDIYGQLQDRGRRRVADAVDRAFGS